MIGMAEMGVCGIGGSRELMMSAQFDKDADFFGLEVPNGATRGNCSIS